ncbi:hypothetical protein [Bacillus sp. FJAT-49736]|uniref:hypothetical protein n=1 Tax=Bacillus sp. FJAT-49736 TaxID=2833582 RepID=UPI001BCA3C52|nr:hypothetical protein [Bacillus sp. FJAT-49736]MBS4174696.1 hypothetical protein [Bacillus sp. FJAT-49736]
MLKRALSILIFVILLSGCHSQPTVGSKQKEPNRKIHQTKQADKKALEQEENSVKSHFEGMIEAAEENNKTKFLSFQNETNQLFYKEQKVWLEDFNQKKKEGWKVSVVINDITLDSLDKGKLELQINMQLKNQDITNHITYPINKINGTWKMNDLPFKKKTEGPLNLYYLPSLESDADIAFTDVEDLVELYSKTFRWKPTEVNVKLYDSLEEISASVAWPTLFGVTSPFTSLKFLVDGSYSEVTYSLMTHEVVHTMLADLSNDNAPTFMQEGLAVFVSSAVTKDDSGKPQLDFNNKVAEREKIILKKTKNIKPISDLKNVNYTDNSIDIYNVGFLITDYLIQTYGLEKYLDMVEVLKKNDIVEDDNPQKEQIVFNRAFKALEQTYGPLDNLSKGYIDYFNKKK